MKKVRRILSLLVILGIFSALCGCTTLDELRASRISIVQDGVLVLPDGTEYIRLPENKEISSNFNSYEYLYVVPETLPLLLTTTSDSDAIISDDGLFLWVFSRYETYFCCRSDMYDSILAQI